MMSLAGIVAVVAVLVGIATLANFGAQAVVRSQHPRRAHFPEIRRALVAKREFMIDVYTRGGVSAQNYLQPEQQRLDAEIADFVPVVHDAVVRSALERILQEANGAFASAPQRTPISVSSLVSSEQQDEIALRMRQEERQVAHARACLKEIARALNHMSRIEGPPLARLGGKGLLLLSLVVIVALSVGIGAVVRWVNPPETTAQRLANAPRTACAAIVADLKAGSPAHGDVVTRLRAASHDLRGATDADRRMIANYIDTDLGNRERFAQEYAQTEGDFEEPGGSTYSFLDHAATACTRLGFPQLQRMRQK